MPNPKNTPNERDRWDSRLFPQQGIYVMRIGAKRMLRQFVDVGKTRMDHYEYGILTTITIALHTSDVLNQFWTIDPTDGEAREQRGVIALLESERNLLNPDEVDGEPLVSWVETEKSTLDGIACRTYRRHLRGIETSCIRYVSIDTGFLIQEDHFLPSGGVKEVIKWTIEFLGAPPAEVFSIEQIQRELRDQAQKKNETRQKGGK